MAAFESMAGDTANLQSGVTGKLAYLALARRLRQPRLPILGLWPTSTEIPFAGVPLRLAEALVSLGIPVGILTPDQWRNQPATEHPTTTTLREGVDAIRPAHALSNISATLERVLQPLRARYGCILLDLSGLDVIALREVALIPEVGTVLFLLPGQLKESDLAKLRRQLPPERLLGVVFLDEEPDP